MIKYNLAKMLAEIERDERGGKGADKKVLTQDEIKAMSRRRRKPAPEKPRSK